MLPSFISINQSYKMYGLKYIGSEVVENDEVYHTIHTMYAESKKKGKFSIYDFFFPNYQNKNIVDLTVNKKSMIMTGDLTNKQVIEIVDIPKIVYVFNLKLVGVVEKTGDKKIIHGFVVNENIQIYNFKKVFDQIFGGK